MKFKSIVYAVKWTAFIAALVVILLTGLLLQHRLLGEVERACTAGGIPAACWVCGDCPAVVKP